MTRNLLQPKTPLHWCNFFTRSYHAMMQWHARPDDEACGVDETSTDATVSCNAISSEVATRTVECPQHHFLWGGVLLGHVGTAGWTGLINLHFTHDLILYLFTFLPFASVSLFIDNSSLFPFSFSFLLITHIRNIFSSLSRSLVIKFQC